MNGAKEPGEKEWRAVHFFHLTLLLSYILYFLKTCIHVQTVQNTSVFVAFGKKDVFNVIKPLKKKKNEKKGNRRNEDETYFFIEHSLFHHSRRAASTFKNTTCEKHRDRVTIMTLRLTCSGQRRHLRLPLLKSGITVQAMTAVEYI